MFRCCQHTITKNIPPSDSAEMLQRGGYFSRPSTDPRAGGQRPGPIVATSDYMALVADQIRPYLSARFSALGTDGFGRSDTRRKLRRFFEVDRYSICVASLSALADEGSSDRSRIAEAIRKYGVDPDKIDPASV